MKEAPQIAGSRETKRPKSVFKTLGTAIGAIMILLIFLFAARIITFYRLIQKGELLELPQFKSRLTSGAPPKVSPALSAKLQTDDDPALGADNPVITIVEFADFQCEHSREAFPVVREMAAKYGSRVRFIFRDFPLEDIHPRARGAAIAANCAGAQGKFWQMHDKIFQHADALTDSDMAGYAEEIGLNLKEFNVCLLNDPAKAEIDADMADGVALGVTGTPTFFINGQKIEGAIPRAVFDKLLNASLVKN
ncbi:thioredoxin domain-containing protein [Candidatus Uhrbacteria bacterium]|nr:thioredoxin domain-containing protein [Candidatus Uhrbacteria bacterium]